MKKLKHHKKRRKKRSFIFRNRILLKRAGYKCRRKKKLNKRKVKLNKRLLNLPANKRLYAINFPDYIQLIAPKLFSLVNNEDKTIKFLNKLRIHLDKKNKVFILLDNVEELSTDAILVLLSNMVNFRIANIEFNGSKPINDEIRSKLENSGFFDHLYNRIHLLQQRSEYSFKKIGSRLYTHGQKTVASDTADELVKYASRIVWGEPRRCPGVQKTLIELMHNTYDHADESKGSKHWWLSVEHNSIKKEVTFSFIDFGVGIFRSIDNKKEGDPLFGIKEYLTNVFPFAKTQSEKLKLMLEGKVKMTQTSEYYRGKGLAKIYNHFLENKINSLVIISNYAYANVGNNDFHSLQHEFMGTFISWKIKSDTYSLKWKI